MARLHVRPLRRDHERHRVDAEARHAELEPVAHDPLDLRAHLGARRVEVRLKIEEAVEVVKARHSVVRPRRRLHGRKHHPFVPAARPLLRPDVPIAVLRLRICARVAKPRMLDGGVVDDEIDDHAHPMLTRLMHELDEVAGRAVARIDAVVVSHVVPVVASRRRVERQDPQAGHAEAGEIVEPAHQPLEVADAVAARVDEPLDVDAVDDGVLVPEVLDQHRAQGAGGRAQVVVVARTPSAPRALPPPFGISHAIRAFVAP